MCCRRHPKAVVADFGCGDDRLAESVSNKVHSFDLVSLCSVDIGVYCLALMGTSVREYVREVYRVLKPGGVLKVAEVKSCFEKESLGGIEITWDCDFEVTSPSKYDTNESFIQ
ncbi:Ribosomal RNA-processing protein [Phytophthora megakarya]|uniref:Ribosomal RNA-processing protein 8 n=1 Tax=Phytophthora megakarya TaxID=4795 RepID=A0A225VIZ5_9STRA|nr:Ribosomal RNA-processing protein [Phytophthora megakarya]